MAIPLADAWRQFGWAAALTGLALVESAVFAVNRVFCLFWCQPPPARLASDYVISARPGWPLDTAKWISTRPPSIVRSVAAGKLHRQLHADVVHEATALIHWGF